MTKKSASRKRWVLGVALFLLLFVAGLTVLEVGLIYALLGLFVVPLTTTYLVLKMATHLKWEDEE